MKKKIIYLSLGVSMGMLMTPLQTQAAEVLVANEDVFYDFRHEIEAAQVQAETANALLHAYAAQKEDADIQVATALSILESLDQYIGGHPGIPIVARLQGYLATIGLDADTLEDVADMLDANLQGVAGDDIVEKINHLKRDLTWMRNEHGKERATKNALRRALAARDQEQEEANQLIHQILCQLIPQEVLVPLPQAALPRLEQPRLEQPREVEALSVYQQRLLDQRQQGKIGDAAWRALGGKNPSLAATLCRVIQENQGKIVDVSYVGTNNFTISINNKLQKNPYKF